VRLSANRQLFRTECSATLDAEVYFHLCTTPLPLRALFGIAHFLPGGQRLREAMINAALYVQRRVSYYRHDYHTYQGMIPLTSWYIWDIPDWAWRAQGLSVTVFSRVNMFLIFHVGRFLLGMKESYDEYGGPILSALASEEKSAEDVPFCR